MKTDIAIIGMSARFPETKDMKDLYEILKNKKDLIKDITEKRIKDTTLKPDEKFRKAGYLDNIDKFDFKYFNISLAEAEAMDPNQKVLLEIVHEAIDNSGYSLSDFSGTNTSVFVSDVNPEYYKLAEEIVDTMVSGNSPAFMASKIARFYNLKGNAAVIDTACSSSLVALNFACSELCTNESDMAVICGTNLNLFPYKFKKHEFAIWSSDDKSRAFSEEADGMSCGECICALIIKRLDDAMRDKDIIHAVIKGIAVNNNANRSASATAPDSISQSAVIVKAWEKAGINPTDIGFIEAHGSGTKLGDCLEIEGLTHSFAKYTDKKQFCPLSTIKSNFGHAYNISGLAGVIKLILALKYKVIFPSIHAENLNSMIDFDNSAVCVEKNFKTWEVPEGQKRIACTTSLGASGTNCHVVLEEAPNANVCNSKICKENYIFPISARSENALKNNISELARILTEKSNLQDISYTLCSGRNHYKHRYSVVSKTFDDLIKKLSNVQLDYGTDNIKVICIFSTSNKVNKNRINTFIESNTIFKETYEKYVNLDSSNEYLADFAYQLGIFEFFKSIGINLKNLLGYGIGKIVEETITKKTNSDNIIEKIKNFIHSTDDLEDKVKRLIERETKSENVCFLNLSNENVLFNLIKNHKNDKVTILDINDYGNPREVALNIIQGLYLLGNDIDFKMFSKIFKGKKTELPPYQFEKTRCWIRKTPMLVKEGEQLNAISSDQQVIIEEKEVSRLEKEIANIFSSVLRIKAISILDSFFEIGGNSLKSTKVINSINEKFQVKLDFEDIYDFQTVKQLSEYIQQQLGTLGMVKNIWESVLKTKDIKNNDSFFDLGGHSLMANQVINKINDDFDIEINFEDIYKNSTLEELSNYVENLKLCNPKSKEKIEHVEPKDYYDVSSAQKRMWILSQISSESIAYNTPFAFELSGNLDVEKFISAIEKLVKRHESLRTVFKIIDAEPKMKILSFEESCFSVRRLDFSNFENYEEKAKEFIKSDFIKQFDLENGPLFKSTIIQLSKDKYVFYSNSHHIINDGWSTHIFLKELIQLYSAFCGNYEPKLEKLKIQYKDYANWFNTKMKSEKSYNDKKYWAKHMSGELPKLALPTDYVRPAFKTNSADTVIFTLGKNIVSDINKLCKNKQCTLFSTLIAGINILLYKYTGQNDIILGTPIAGRIHKDLENQIGLYINTVCIRNSFSPHETISSLLDHIKDNLVNVYNHQEYPFDQLVNDLKIERDPSRSPVFDVLVSLHNTNFISENKFLGNGLSFKNILNDRVSSFIDISIEFEEKNSDIECAITYNTDLFKKSRIQRFGAHLTKILSKLMSSLDVNIKDVECMDKEEKDQVIKFSCGKKIENNKLTIESIFENIEKYKDKVAVICDEQQLTYEALGKRIDILAQNLKNKGITEKSVVGVMLEKGINSLVSMLAIWKLGACYLPLDKNLPNERLLHIVNNSNLNISILDRTTFDKYELFPEHFLFDQSTNIEICIYIEPYKCNQTQLAYIIFTSGSTGIPKGAMVEHIGMTNHINSTIEDFEIKQNSVVAQSASECFDISIWQFLAALVVGGTTVIYKNHEIMNTFNFVQKINKDKISILELVPSYLSLVLQVANPKNDDFKSLKCLITIGEELKPNLVQKWFKNFSQKKLINAYGPTETSDDVTHFLTSINKDNEFISIGYPIRNSNVYVMDEFMNICPIFVKGEICVSGVCVGKGYVNDKERTLKSFIFNSKKIDEPRLYKTGDLAYYNQDGKLMFCGRKDYQVKIRGFRIELLDVENAILSNPNVKEAVVIDSKDERNNAKLIAYIVSGIILEEKNIKLFLKDKLPNYMIPSDIIFLNQMPLNTNGKIDRKALPSKDYTKVSCNKIYAKTDSEKSLAKLWCEVLTLDEISIEDNFFYVGGDSIKALKLIIEAQKQGICFEFKDIFEHQTLEELAKFIDLNITKYKDLSNEKENIKKEFEKHKQEAKKIYNDVCDAYPASEVESGLIFHSLNNFESGVHHVQMVYQAKYEDFDTNLFNKALNILTNNSDNLKSSFDFENFEVPLKIVHMNPNINVNFINIENLDKKDQEKFIENYAMEDKKKPFDFSKTPLWRLYIFEIGNNNKLFLFIYHQAVMDGWSNATLMSELFEIYNYLKNSSEISKLPINSYKEFVAEQIVEITNEENKSYWKNTLDSYKKLDFACLSKAVSDTYLYSLNSDVLDILNELSEKLNTTTKNLCFSIYIRILSLIGKTTDITTAILAHNRPFCEDSDKIIGYFLNMVPIRIIFEENMRFIDFVKMIDEKLIKVKSYERMPFSQIVKIIGEQYISETPITDTMFNFTDFNITKDMSELKNGSIEDQESQLSIKSNADTNTLLDINIDVTFGRIDFKIDSTLYDFEFFQKIIDLFKGTIERLSCNKELSVSDILLENNNLEMNFDFNF